MKVSVYEKIYAGKRTPQGPVVWVNGEILNPRQDLRDHSPTGFEWGYGGSGPSQLALAILVDFLGLGREKLALMLYQDFKFQVVAGLSHSEWRLDSEALKTWLVGQISSLAGDMTLLTLVRLIRLVAFPEDVNLPDLVRQLEKVKDERDSLMRLLLYQSQFEPDDGQELLEYAMEKSQPWNAVCRKCGCSWFQPCDPPCSWVEPDLCSSCYPERLTRPRKRGQVKEKEDSNG